MLLWMQDFYFDKSNQFCQTIFATQVKSSLFMPLNKTQNIQN